MHTRSPTPWLLLLALAGCDDAPDEKPSEDQGIVSDGARSDAALDAGPDADPDADPDASLPDAAPLDAAPPDAAPDASLAAEACPRTEAGQCDAVGWLTAPTAYPVVVDHHTTLAAPAADGVWLNVFGGISSDDLGGAEAVYAEVRRARIAGDTVGAFEAVTPLPRPMAFHAQIVVGDRVYLLGGITAGGAGHEHEVGANPRYVFGRLVDGQVPAWEEGDLPAEVRVHPTGAAIGKRLYVIGGTGTQGRVLDTVLSAEVGPDGRPGPFTPGPPLPAPRSHHASAVVGGHLIIAGGFTTGQVPAPEIWRSVHAPDGTLTGFEEVGRLENPPWTSSAVVHRGWLWLVGGGEGEGNDAHFVATVRGAPLDAEGRPGPFEVLHRPLPLARSHVHQTPVVDGFIYSVGGRVAEGAALRSTNRILVGELW